jgi:YVTN family beta-propeller protein
MRSGTVSVIDLKTRTKQPPDIPVGSGPFAMAITPDGKTAFVTNFGSLSPGTTPNPESVGTVSVIDVKTRTKEPTDIPVGAQPGSPAITPDGKTLLVPNYGDGTVSTIDVKTRAKHLTDIRVGSEPIAVAVTPCRR